MTKEYYLSERGGKIFDAIYAHCKKLGIADDIDTFEMSMLANSIDLYGKATYDCSINGTTHEFDTGYTQIRASYTVMRTEYGNILKHSPKFGLNPSDREKLVKFAKQPGEYPDFSDL